MTYKEIIKLIEMYEKKLQSIWYVYGEHRSKTAEKQFYIEFFKNEAAKSALFDAVSLRSSNVLKSKDEIDKYIEDYEANIETLCNKLIAEGKNEESKNTKESVLIYKVIFADIFKLDNEGFLKIAKYAERKRKKRLKSDVKNKKIEEKEFINAIVKSVNKNYEIYTKAKGDRENTIHHVGTSQEFIEAFNNIITKEELMYSLYTNAINLAFSSSYITEEDIKANFSFVIAKLENNRDYYDEEVKELSENGFDLYKTAYYKVLCLGKKSKSKLNKKLQDKLNG